MLDSKEINMIYFCFSCFSIALVLVLVAVIFYSWPILFVAFLFALMGWIVPISRAFF